MTLARYSRIKSERMILARYSGTVLRYSAALLRLSFGASIGTAFTLPAGVPPVADLYVDAGANCGIGAGTMAQPYCTIGEAVAGAVDGDVIRIAAGSYVENLVLDSDVTLVGTSGQALTTIDGGMNGSVVTVTFTGDATVDGVTITGGSDSGITNRGYLVLRNSTVTGNTVTTNFGGGGIYHDRAGTLTLRNVLVSGNSALGGTGAFGGGIFAGVGGRVWIESSTISGNTALRGGGTYSFGNDVTIMSSTVSGNRANSHGAVLLDGFSEIINSTISGNMGGGVSFTQSLFSGNYLRIRSSTIFGNDGGGVSHGLPGAVSIANSVVAGTINAEDLTDFCVSNGFNFVGSSSGLTGLVDGVNGDQVGSPAAPIDPFLGPLMRNGGPTMTHQALAGSPLIGRGNQVHLEPVDQRGAVRVAGYVDIGSTEENNGNLPGCSSVPNSTGSIGAIAYSGSLEAVEDNFTLTMSSLPPHQFGAFLVAPRPGFLANPAGSAGHLCLDGTIGRFFLPSQIMGSGPSGAISLRVPLTMMPQGNGFVVALPGETWFFQGWHRDVIVGTPASNFSAAIGVLLR